MIATLRGTLTQKSANTVIVDVNGIGYRVCVPLSTFYELPDIGLPVFLNVYTHVKDDAIQLFGFCTVEEKRVFLLMISVSGIGPRLATNILSGISAAELTRAVCSEDVKKLMSIPGVGRKMADRMIFELKEKLTQLLSYEEEAVVDAGRESEELLREDALSALVNLGYKNNTAKTIIDRVTAESADGLTLEILLKKALKILAK